MKCFQYKVLHNILPVKAKLYKGYLSVTANCRFCNVAEETTVHLFGECMITSTFWRNFETFYSRINDRNLPLTKTTILLGIDCKDTLLNYLLIVAKAFIFKAQTIENINFISFLNLVQYKFVLEQEAAKATGRWTTFLSKWEAYAAVFTG